MTTEVFCPTKPTDYASVVQWLIPLWKELLNMEVIVPESDFFDLGADSLMVIRLLHRVEQTFGKNVMSLNDLFEQSQLDQMAAAIARSLPVN